MAMQRLVDAKWLHQNKSETIRILDCTFVPGRPMERQLFMDKFYGEWPALMARSTPQKDAYAQSHIPTAVHLDLDIATYPGMTERFALYPPELFEQYVRLLGVNNGDHLVLYDRGPMGGMLFSSKIWWLFRIYGHDNISLLNGGFNAWTSQGLPVTDQIEHVEKGDWTVNKFRPDLNVSFEELTKKDVQNNKDIIDRHDEFNLFDARGGRQFRGEEDTTFDPNHVPGTFIPGFHSVPAIDTIAKDGTMKSPDEIKKFLTERGYRDGQPVIATCNAGIQSCLLALALEQAYPNAPVRVYNGSLKEMEIRDPKRISGRVSTTD